MYNYNKSVLSPYDPTKACNSFYFASIRWSYIKLWSKFEKKCFFWWRYTLHWRGEHGDLCRFWLCRYFLAWKSFKNQTDQPRTEIHFQIPWKTQCIPSNDQHTCVVDEQHSSNIFLNPYNLWDMVPAALMSLSDTNDTYSMFNQYPQPKTQQPRADAYPVFSSLRTMNSKRKGLRVSFAFFQRSYLPDGRMNETVAKVEELGDLWKPGAMDGTAPFVMNRNCI